MKTWVILLSGLIGAAAYAAGNDDFYENQCHDPAVWAKMDALLKQVPNDPLVIRTYALRRGICDLVDEGQISLENGIRIFDIERQRAIMERSMEEGARKPKQPVAPEDLDPVS